VRVRAIDELLDNNDRFVSSFSYASLAPHPAHAVALLTCMDARIDPALALGLVPGDAHVLRNAGGIVTADAERSIAVSQRALGTREVMVVQHTRCGMHGLEATALGLPPGTPLGAFDDLETSVRSSVARLRASELLLHRDDIRGFVYEVETGRVRELT
jgi:carbonic anhydrase